ncbi:ATP-dependent endonuclease [Fulvitalea axinellae]|uniref:ATP-dependent endonuclease n=1 Tax=Fulvitalea axinellae TaxID=1182444 RepID=A0AAU9CTU5_9BACT|nr:ATP-dependent endonuclease [Fulvitalea axinellae]
MTTEYKNNGFPDISGSLTRLFPHNPTEGQLRLFQLFGDLLQPSFSDTKALLLRGYAGTGKTSVIGALVKALPLSGYRYVLMAPTGRAAKVMSKYAKRRAFTIHKLIYRQVADGHTGEMAFRPQKNYATKTVFIVDEASMLSDDSGFGGQSLLSDLIEFVYTDSTNRLMLIGDDAQLPPVGQALSPGMDKAYLEANFALNVLEATLTEVVRQGQESGILYNATRLRASLAKSENDILFETKKYSDTFRMTSDKLEDGLRYAYDKYGTENTVIVCRSNRSAVQFNQYIRRVVHFYDEEIEAGDLLMVVRNNYSCLPSDSPAGFLANGDFAEVVKIVDFEERYGHRFACLSLRLPDFPEQPAFETMVMLDTLYSDAPSLGYAEYRKLFDSVKAEYADLTSKKALREALDKDPHLNALQIKFAYALTCHKSQGGQWNAVFVDQGYLTDDMLGTEYLRWLYTAVTRATDELFLVNFRPEFFGLSPEGFEF